MGGTPSRTDSVKKFFTTNLKIIVGFVRWKWQMFKRVAKIIRCTNTDLLQRQIRESYTSWWRGVATGRVSTCSFFTSFSTTAPFNTNASFNAHFWPFLSSFIHSFIHFMHFIRVLAIKISFISRFIWIPPHPPLLDKKLAKQFWFCNSWKFWERCFWGEQI